MSPRYLARRGCLRSGRTRPPAVAELTRRRCSIALAPPCTCTSMPGPRCFQCSRCSPPSRCCSRHSIRAAARSRSKIISPPMSIREELERREREILVPAAAKSADSKGRLRPETEDAIRPSFQRDRDRIIHTKAFRRLKHKTQVFFSPAGDHYRTRLTHTLEVAQIARTIAKVLRLHEELTEAIALGHDLGHTPFGHAGERVLSDLVPGGFNHYEQSLRIVDVLEDRKSVV